MILIYSISIILAITWTVSAGGLCYQFTWNADLKPGSVNCTDLKGRPCALPIVFTDDNTPPDTYSMWNNESFSEHFCALAPGSNTCIKYSYAYDTAVEHIAYFCGKMTQNNETPITSGCYTSKVNGYTIEACACVTEGDDKTMPCNSSGRTHIAIINLAIILVLLTMISDYEFFAKKTHL